MSSDHEIEEAVDGLIRARRAEAVALLAASRRARDAAERAQLAAEAIAAREEYRREKRERFVSIVRLRRTGAERRLARLLAPAGTQRPGAPRPPNTIESAPDFAELLARSTSP